MQSVRVAAVQHAPVVLDRAASVEKGAALIDEAARGGADLVVFPETWLPGYPFWIFGAGFHAPGMQDVHARLLRNSVRVPSESTEVICEAARRNRVHVVMGLNELGDSAGTIYNSLLYVSRDGEILGVHRKLTPTSAERMVWGVGDGSTLHVFDTDVGRLGGLICWEHWMPLARFAMHARGEHIHVAAWPELPEIHQLAARTYAFEGRCFVVCAGMYLPETAMPRDFEAPEAVRALADTYSSEPGVLLPGGSGVIGPDGNWIAGPAGNEETIVYGDVDLEAIPSAFQALDVVGHYNRPDVFQLTVDVRPRSPLVWRDDTIADAAAGDDG